MVKNFVVKDNALINASYNLELVEQRLILLAIVEARRIKQTINSNSFLTIYAESYINKFGVHRNVAYQALKDACNHLFERRFTYQKLTAKGNKEIVTSRWVQSISYVQHEAIVRLKFSDDVAPLIHNLERHFTSYELEQISELNSKYSVRLYEITIAWRSIGKTPMFTIANLREQLGVCENEYTELKNLKARVLDFSIKNINEKTDISIMYEQHKQGRKIIGFTFIITQKLATLVQSEISRNQSTKAYDLFAEFSEQECTLIQMRIAEHITRLEAKGEIVSELHRRNITNMAVKERWGLDELQAKREQRQQIDEHKVIEQRWQDTPNGTRFRHTKDGSVWLKEAGFLRNTENRVVPDGQVINVFKNLKCISDI